MSNENTLTPPSRASHDPPTPAPDYDLQVDAAQAALDVGPARDGTSADVDVDVPKRPFSAFTPRQKLFLVCMASLAGMFSPFTANIYFPAIPILADAFHKPVELINVTVTVYMIMQGVSPMPWGTVADRFGRRPVYMGCLLILCLTCIGLALVPTSDYWLLVLLRCIQAAGSAPTVAISAGTIADISTPAERGFYLGIFSLGPMFGPCLGPVIGGGLSDSLGWRAIFWFMSIASGIYLVILYLLMPETLRAQVGDGSIPAPRWNRPLLSLITRTSSSSSIERPPRKRFVNPGRMLVQPDVLLILSYNAVIYAAFYAVITLMSNDFITIYPFLNETEVGLCFLAVGGGQIFGSVVTGRLLDWEYRRVKRAHALSIAEGKGKEGEKAGDFPIEVARLRMLPLYLIVFVAAVIGYGWVLETRTSIAAAVVLLIIIGWTAMAFMNATQALIMDLFPAQGSAITACNNLVRCLTGAGYVSFIGVLSGAVGTGWACVVICAVCVVGAPLMWVEMRMGPRWRAQRRERAQREEKERSEKEDAKLG